MVNFIFKVREKPKKGQVNPKIDNFIFKHKQNLKKGQLFFLVKKNITLLYIFCGSTI